MVNSVFASSANLFKNIIDAVDSSSDEDKLVIKSEINKAQRVIDLKISDYEKQLFDAQSENKKTENQSWMQKNWRPIAMLTFLFLIVCDSFGLLAFRLSNDAWTLLQLGFTGYVVGRSAEKTLPSILSAVKK